jgi:Fe-S cluster biogenesis protein NfuA
MTDSAKSELEHKVRLVLDSVRPYLLADGGDIQLVSVTNEMNAEVFLLGACNSCGMSFQTLASVECSIKSSIPEINRVIAIDYNFE